MALLLVYFSLLLLMTSLSAVIWEKFWFLQAVQFSWRLLGITASLQVLASLGLYTLKYNKKIVNGIILVNLVATAMFDNTWQFKDFGAELQPPTISNVTGGFGLGTVGNGAVDNSFNGNITGDIDYSIYAPPIDTANLQNTNLVRDSATFTFTGVSGYTEADIVDLYAFGLGTAPDSLLIPEPSTLILLGLGSLILLPRKKQ